VRSYEVVGRTGASYRMVDYWTRLGLLGDHEAGGSGSRRDYQEHQVVLVRAFVLASQLARPSYHRYDQLEPAVRRAWETDPTLTGYWLVMTSEDVLVVHHRRDKVPLATAVLMVDLGAAAADIRDGEPHRLAG
jgi:hypothetical protein